MRDAVSDPGDPYLNSWILWWDYHQTFHDPLNLFNANIFYPYRYSLAFSENNYGLALIFFPLFALGLRPLTVHGLAVLFGFAFSGYGAYRLGRTLGHSNGMACVTGVIFAFLPYRFHHLSHVNYLSAGWIPLLLESLLLFAQVRSKKRALWLGVAFLMNALSCIHWFVLTLIPMLFSIAFVVIALGLARDRSFWLRGSISLSVALLALFPFLLPYHKASVLYGFARTPEEVARFSATFASWVTVDWRNKLWHGLNAYRYTTELALFPGLLPLILSGTAFIAGRNRRPSSASPLCVASETYSKSWARKLVPLLLALDVMTILALLNTLLVTVFGPINIHFHQHRIFRSSTTERAIEIAAAAFLCRCLVSYPRVLAFRSGNLFQTIRQGRRSLALWLGSIWIVIGFAGSFGMNFLFHRTLFLSISLFRSIRVPARWAMICDLGLAILAGAGAVYCAREIAARARVSPTLIIAVIVVLVLFEQRSFPLDLIRGAVDPDEVTDRLKRTPMRGGIVELPAGKGSLNYLYVLRAADHERPLITAVSGFTTPLEVQIETLTQPEQISERFLDLLESTPASYLVIHFSYLYPDAAVKMRTFLAGAVNSGRLCFVQNYRGEMGDELYLVVKTESPGSGSRIIGAANE